jgi:AraC family transcriptional regulator
MSNACAALSPTQWGESLGGAPDLCSAARGSWNGALVRRWRGTSPQIEQPPLDHHYLVLHLGGPKRVNRRSAHSTTIHDAETGAITLATAGSAYSWTTEGPIGFAHLYLHPHCIDHVITEEFDRDSRSVELVDCVARRVPLLSALMIGMLEQLESPTFGSRLVLDTLLHSLIVHLVSECSTLSEEGSSAPHSIAPRRLQRVLDFIDSNFGADIELDDLASVAGSSRFHFSRAFREATGFPPYRYLIQRRIDEAKCLLLEDSLTIAEIAEHCGFHSQAQLSAMFRRVFGTSPAQFRKEH